MEQRGAKQISQYSNRSNRINITINGGVHYGSHREYLSSWAVVKPYTAQYQVDPIGSLNIGEQQNYSFIALAIFDKGSGTSKNRDSIKVAYR